MDGHCSNGTFVADETVMSMGLLCPLEKMGMIVGTVEVFLLVGLR